MIQKKYKTKSEMVCCLVRKDIIKGILRPGTRLIISNVAKQFDVSEIPVREAFQILVQDGFINTAPNARFRGQRAVEGRRARDLRNPCFA
jgi:DNA-binding GntR family transcriptional regulator